MISPRWRKVLSDFKGNRSRTIIVVLSIAIGVFAVGSMAFLKDILFRDLYKNWQFVNYANVTIQAQPFKEDLVETVRKIPGVADAVGHRTLSMRVQVGEKWKNIELHVYPDDLDTVQINKVQEVAGSWPPDPNQVFLERAVLKYLNKKVGDSITVENTNGKKKELTIAGIVHDGSQMSPTVSQIVNGYITRDNLDDFAEIRQFDSLAITVTGDQSDPENIQQVAAKVRDKVERSGREVWFTQITKSDEHPAVKYVNSLTKILGALGLGALLLSGFLLFNTLSAVLQQQMRQIGVMKAIGASTVQIMQLYLAMVVGYGLMALLIAIPAGSLVANVLASMAAANFNIDRSGFSISFSVWAIQIAVGLGIPLLAAILPILSGTRLTVREALSSYGLDGNVGSKQGFTDRVLEKIKGFPRPILLSLRNTFRQKGRLALTLAALTMGGAIFISVLSVYNSLMLTTDNALEYFKYDVQTAFANTYRTEKIEQVAMTVPGVVKAECWGFGSARLFMDDVNKEEDSDKITIIAPPAQTEMLQPTLQAGRWLVAEDENAVVVNSEVLKNNPWIKLGNQITLLIGNRETRWQVVGITRSVLTGPLLYTNYPYFSRVTNSTGMAASVQVTTQQYDAALQVKMASALEDAYKRAGLDVAQVTATVDVRNQIKTSFSFIVSFLMIMAILMGVVGGLGLMGTMSMNVVERTREIGVMRAIGAPNRSILQIFLVEGVIISIMSWALGALLALVVSKPISDSVGMILLNSKLSYSFSVSGVFIWLIIVVIVAVLASWLPARNASRISVHEALAYE